MISSVLKSEVAVDISIQIMQAFVAMRKFLINHASVFQRLDPRTAAVIRYAAREQT